MRWCLALLLIVCCTPKDESPLTIVWEGNKAIAVSIAEPSDSLEVSLKGWPYPVIGEYKVNDGRSVFTPAVPFERGSEYVVTIGSRTIHSFLVPAETTRRVPVLMGSFPSCDTVPSNLLKMYLQFSEPMMEGRSSQFVQLFDEATGDTIRNAFLNLQPELWNEDGTILTLWLDPGRIKQDLIPNKTLGVVLNDNRRYRLSVAKGWRSKNGRSIEDGYHRTFITSTRDVAKPDKSLWLLKASPDSVTVSLNESLDWLLLNNTLSLWSGNDEVQSKTNVGSCERSVTIRPVRRLGPGTYTLKIEARLEDPAGNNLNRLFETDLAKPETSDDENFYSLSFRIN